MIDYNRVAEEIKYVGLYDFILQEIQNSLGKASLSKEEILDALDKNPKILEEYKSTNVVNNISNIHIENVAVNTSNDQMSSIAKNINSNLNLLRDIEKYTLSFEESPTLVFIFSIEFFVLFSVQYFIVLLGLKDWQWEIYGTFALSVIIAWLYAKKQKEKYNINNKKFQQVYTETESLLKKMGMGEGVFFKMQ
ncbi:MAG: hypothetical protein PHQ22_00030 [Sulfuricurvum sp.]|nr:hypothetical protein [Sulfuricurvum sp.]MDD5385564.1 hypothetical protein [Sulfuricurvum sp.]